MDLLLLEKTLLGLFVAVIVAITISKLRGKRFKLPPGPLPVPVFGNWLQVGDDLNHRNLTDLTKKFGDIFLLRMGQRNLVVVSSPELAKEVLHTQGVEFGSRTRNVVFDIFTGKGQDMVFTVYGEHWRKMRRIMTVPFFTNKVVQQYRVGWEDEAGLVVEDVKNNPEAATNGTILRRRLQLMMYNNMYRIMFDKRFESEDDPLFVRLKALNGERSRLAQSFEYNYGDFIPILRPFLRGYLKICKEVKERRLQLFKDHFVEERKKVGSTKSMNINNEGLKCAIDHILDAQQKGEIDEDNVLYIVENINVAVFAERTQTMLQWMGGSRRKVTISRKSTHNRQKQYFEQRKQQQQMAVSEGYADENSVAGRHQKECRSLDILSLLNLSTVSDEGKSCPSRSDGKFGASTMKYHIPKDPTTIITSSVPPSYSVKIKEAGAPPSSYQGELQYPKVSFCSHDNHDLNGANNSLDLWNATTENQLSVFDMLINDASEGSSERSLVHEAHVAFSIEGLGKIRTETPLHSPKQEGRISSDDCSLPWNIARQLNSSKSSNYVLNDLELEVDAMMQDIDIPLGGNPSEFSMDIADSHGNWKPKLSTFADHMQLDSHYRNRKCSFGDTDISYNIRREDIWDAKVSFPDDDFLHKREDDVSWKYWPHKIDGDSGDFLDYEKGEMSDAFEGHHMLRKRDVKATKSNSLEPSPKRSSSEVCHDFTTLIGVRHTPIQRNYDIRDLPVQPDWPFFETEDAKDNLSLLSEESCSSSAVRGETINSSPPNLMPRQSRRISNTYGRTRMKYDVDNVFAEETRCKDRDNLGQPSGKYMRTPVLPKSKATKTASYCFRGEIGLSQTWLLEEGCNSVDIDLGLSSSHCTSEANLPSVGSKLWAEDPIGAFPVPELNLDVKSCFNRPKHGESIQCSPFGCFTSEKFAFCPPFNHTNSYDSPVFSNVGPGSIKRVLSPDSRIQGVPLDLSDTAGPHRETGFPDLSVKGRISGDKRKSKFLPANCEQLEFEMENCLGNDLLFSKEPITMDGSNPNNKKDLGCKEAKDGTLKTKESHGVETSSVKIHEKCESKGYLELIFPTCHHFCFFTT